jgi:hypothetical protein
MAKHLDKAGILQKLSFYGVRSLAEVNRLSREQGLPTEYISPRKPFWVEEKVDIWLNWRNKTLVKDNTLHAKTLATQRKERKKAAKAALGGFLPLPALSASAVSAPTVKASKGGTE